jgi:hypothetical protein
MLGDHATWGKQVPLAGLAPSADMTAQPFTAVLAGDTDTARPYLVSGLDRTAEEIEMAARHYGSTTWTRLRGWRSIATADRKLVVSADLPEPVLLDISAGRVAGGRGRDDHDGVGTL